MELITCTRCEKTDYAHMQHFVLNGIGEIVHRNTNECTKNLLYYNKPTRIAVFGPCMSKYAHASHVFDIGVVDPDGVKVLQKCFGVE